MSYHIEVKGDDGRWRRFTKNPLPTERDAEKHIDEIVATYGWDRNRLRAACMEHTHEIATYLDLLRSLQAMADAELDQPIQLVPPHSDGDATLALLPVYAIGPVSEIGQPTRSAFDNTHRPDHIVLYADGHPFGEDGAIAEDLESGERIFPARDLAAEYDRMQASLKNAFRKGDERYARTIRAILERRP